MCRSVVALIWTQLCLIRASKRRSFLVAIKLLRFYLLVSSAGVNVQSDGSAAYLAYEGFDRLVGVMTSVRSSIIHSDDTEPTSNKLKVNLRNKKSGGGSEEDRL